MNFLGATTFSVREDWTVPGRKVKAKARAAASLGLARVQQQHRNELNLTAKTAKGSLSPYFDPDAMARAGFGHGNVSIDALGKMVRWHQVALGISVAVPLDEWDDTVHIASNRFIPYGNAYDHIYDPRTGAVAAHPECAPGGTCVQLEPC